MKISESHAVGIAEKQGDSDYGAFILLDSEGRHLKVDRKFVRLVGIGEEDLLGNGHPYPYWPFDSPSLDSLFEAARGGIPAEVAISIRSNDGTDHPVRVILTAIGSEGESALAYTAEFRAIQAGGRGGQRQRLRQEESQAFRILEAVSRTISGLLGRSGRMAGTGESGAFESEPLSGAQYPPLGLIGEAARVSRVYVFENHLSADGTLLTSQRAEWVAEGVDAEPDLINIPLLEAGFSRWIDTLSEGGIISGNIDGFPEAERAFLEPQGIVSIIIVPVFIDGEWWGFMGFDECTRPRVWLHSETEALRVASETISAAVRGDRADREIREADRSHRLIMDSLPAMIAYVGADLRVRFNNALYAERYGMAPEEMIGMHVSEILSEEAVKEVTPHIEAVLQGERRTFQRNYFAEDGSRTCLSVTYIPDRLGTGEIAGFYIHVFDITDRILAEESLRESEERWRSALENISDFLLILDRKGKILEANRLRPDQRDEDVIGKDSADYYATDHRDDWLRMIQKVFETGESQSFELPAEGPFAMESWYSGELIPIRRSGDVKKIMLIASDITERKWGEQALRESEERLKLALEGAQDGIWDWNVETGQLIFNRRWATMLGYSLTEIAPHVESWNRFIHPDDLPGVMKRLNEHLEGKTELYVSEHRLRTKSGNWRWILDRGKVVTRDEQGKALRVTGTHKDIGERKIAEEELRKSETSLARSQRIARLGSFEWDMATDEVIWSDELYRIMGHIPQDFTPGYASFIDLTHPEDRKGLEDAIRETIEQGLPLRVNHRIILSDGSTRYLHCEGELQRDEEGRAIRLVGVAQDVTDRYEAEQEIRKSRSQLRALAEKLQTIREEEKSSIAREIHDELGQILTVLKMDLSWIKRRVEKETREIDREVLERLSTMSDEIDETIGTVRRISTQLRPRVLDDLDLAGAIEWQAGDFERHTGIVCRLRASVDDLDLDPDRTTAVFRIFQETLTNVARHSGAGRVDIDFYLDGDELRLRVRDNGRGILMRELKSDRTLGILGMRERAHVFGGDVLIKGKRGRGTEVSIRVPLEPTPGEGKR